MSFIATLVNAENLKWGEVSAACDALATAGASGIDARWLEEAQAADISFSASARPDIATQSGTDIIIQIEAERRRSLLVADMDSTMITIECIDELADYAGIKPQIAEITERAMRGELDFEGALRERVGLLKGLKESVIDDCLRERMKIMPGAIALVRTLNAHGGRAVLVSGGFTRFTDVVGPQIGFDRTVSNVLGITQGVLDGSVVGDIVGAQTKRATLLEELAARALPASASLAIGDGANDIPMIEAAGLGVAYHAKPKTAAAAPARVQYGDLSVLLYACGYARKDWVIT
ncbi:MAG: phosphoserine phosphatase SerB [Alphaproteobacteria bacterium]|nr:phosphoserine phosphatase SerB [Alphaproteobacteria bacterium]